MVIFLLLVNRNLWTLDLFLVFKNNTILNPKRRVIRQLWSKCKVHYVWNQKTWALVFAVSLPAPTYRKLCNHSSSLQWKWSQIVNRKHYMFVFLFCTPGLAVLRNSKLEGWLWGVCLVFSLGPLPTAFVAEEKWLWPWASLPLGSHTAVPSTVARGGAQVQG